jgi:hypothetical protein
MIGISGIENTAPRGPNGIRGIILIIGVKINVGRKVIH